MTDPSRIKPLSSLIRGETARIAVVGAGSGGMGSAAEDLAQRLMEIGFEEGKDIEVLHVGPLGGDPMAVRIDRLTIAIRRAEADTILVEGYQQ